jgi:hypothetical protein
LFFRPKAENHEPPRRKMVGATATVSTLVTVCVCVCVCVCVFFCMSE